MRSLKPQHGRELQHTPTDTSLGANRSARAGASVAHMHQSCIEDCYLQAVICWERARLNHLWPQRGSRAIQGALAQGVRDAGHHQQAADCCKTATAALPVCPRVNLQSHR